MTLPCALAIPSNARMSTGSSLLGVAAAFVALAAPLRAADVRELRGVWITADTDVFASQASIAEAMDFLSRNHVNVVFPDVWYRGVTLYPSALVEKTFGTRIDPRFGGRDPLQELVVEAHRRGIEVIPWFEQGFVASHVDHPTRLLELKPGWAAKDRKGQTTQRDGSTWMNAFDPDVQAFVSGLMLEVARGYDVDGVQGDERLPALPSTAGYDAHTTSLWESERDRDAPDPTDPNWLAWRAGLLTDFLARLGKDVRAVSPGMLLSSAPSPWRAGLDASLQDSTTWVRRGLVDLVHPACFRRDAAAYMDVADEQFAVMPRLGGAKFAPGILIQTADWRASAQDLVAMVEHGRDRGFHGEVLYSYAGLRANDGELARALRRGPYAERARVPHRSQHWRPPGIELPSDAARTGAWTPIEGRAGFVRADADGAAELTYVLRAPVTAWFEAYLEVPEAEGLPKRVTRHFVGAEGSVESSPINVAPGLLALGSVQVSSGKERELVRIEVPAQERGRMAVGRVVLILDRKKSADVVWKERR